MTKPPPTKPRPRPRDAEQRPSCPDCGATLYDHNTRYDSRRELKLCAVCDLQEQRRRLNAIGPSQ